MIGKPQRVAIYARVSTDETRQDPETQLRQLREYAANREFEIVGEYIDYASGRNAERTGYKQLIDIELINRVDEFGRLGVDFISYQQNVDTTTDIGKLYFTMMAGLAEYESSQIGRRVKAGMDRAKAQGKRISRPPPSEHKQKRIKELGQQKVSIRKSSNVA